MKVLSAILGAAVLLLLVAFVYQHQKTAKLEAALATIGTDRDKLHHELTLLTDRVADLQRRATVTNATGSSPTTASVRSAAAPVAAALPEPVERPGVTIKAPAGWYHNGKKSEMYVVGVDSNETWGGMPSAYVESRTPTVDGGGFGGMMQSASAQDYAGKRVRLSGWVKTQEANEGGGHLWLRIDGQERGQTLGFDNMDNRPVKGNADWQEASLVLDVPLDARALAYGFFVSGGGKMWVSGQRIEVVGNDVPTTNMLKNPVLPATPRNLGFGPTGQK